MVWFNLRTNLKPAYLLGFSALFGNPWLKNKNYATECFTGKHLNRIKYTTTCMVIGHSTETYKNLPIVVFFLARTKVNWVDQLRSDPRFLIVQTFQVILLCLFTVDATTLTISRILTQTSPWRPMVQIPCASSRWGNLKWRWSGVKNYFIITQIFAILIKSI